MTIRHQRGFAMAEFGLIMIIFTLMTLALVRTLSRIHQMDLARTQADVLEMVRSHAHRLVTDRLEDYRRGQPFVYGGLAFADGDDPGNSRRPTLAQLRTLFPTLSSLPDTGQYKTLSQARYEVRITRATACVTNPADPQCTVIGMVCLDRPLSELNGEFDAEGLTHILGRMGGNAGVSLPTHPGTIFGEADWRWPNPYGQRVGIVCGRFGDGATTGQASGGTGISAGTTPIDTSLFLRVGDTRDPQLQNMRTSIAGSLYAGPNATAGGCGLAEVLNSGQVLVRTAQCIRRVWMDGNTGSLNVANAAGQTRVIVGTHETTGQGDILTDTLRNHDNSVGFNNNGTVHGQTGRFTQLETDNARIQRSLTLLQEEQIDSPCTEVGGLAWGRYTSGSSRRVLARCHLRPGANTPTWEFTGGLREAQLDQACNDLTELATTPGMQTLYCSGGRWAYLADRTGRRILHETKYVSTATLPSPNSPPSVDAPNCLPGAIGSSIVLVPASEEQRIQRVTRYAQATSTPPGGWHVYAIDGSGAPVAGHVIAHTYCDY